MQKKNSEKKEDEERRGDEPLVSLDHMFLDLSVGRRLVDRLFWSVERAIRMTQRDNENLF